MVLNEEKSKTLHGRLYPPAKRYSLDLVTQKQDREGLRICIVIETAQQPKFPPRQIAL